MGMAPATAAVPGLVDHRRSVRWGELRSWSGGASGATRRPPPTTESGASSDPRPVGGYAALLGTYGLGTAVAVWHLRSRRQAVDRLDLRRLVILALATQHVSRLITKDSVTAPLRAPFTRFVEAAGEGEVNEEVARAGLAHAIGELLTCPYCIAQWVATALVAGVVAAPELTEGFAAVCALARVSDYLQLAYEHLKPET